MLFPAPESSLFTLVTRSEPESRDSSSKIDSCSAALERITARFDRLEEGIVRGTNVHQDDTRTNVLSTTCRQGSFGYPLGFELLKTRRRRHSVQTMLGWRGLHRVSSRRDVRSPIFRVWAGSCQTVCVLGRLGSPVARKGLICWIVMMDSGNYMMLEMRYIGPRTRIFRCC